MTTSDRADLRAEGAENAPQGQPRPNGKIYDSWVRNGEALVRSDIGKDSFLKVDLQHLWLHTQARVSQLEARLRELQHNLTNLVFQYQQDLARLDRRLGPCSEVWRHAEGRKEGTKAQLDILVAELKRSCCAKPVLPYLFLMALLALAELPINKASFELLFSDTPMVALMLALLVGSILVLCSHQIGLWLRQAGHYAARAGRLASYAGAVLLLVFVGALVMVLAFMRLAFLSVQETGAVTDLFAPQLVSDAVTFVLLGLPLSAWSLLALNTAVVVAGILLALWRHDPHPHLEGLTTEAEKAEAEFLEIVAAYEQAKKRLSADYNAQRRFYEGRISEIQGELAHRKSELGMKTAEVTDVIDEHVADPKPGVENEND